MPCVSGARQVHPNWGLGSASARDARERIVGHVQRPRTMGLKPKNYQLIEKRVESIGLDQQHDMR